MSDMAEIYVRNELTGGIDVIRMLPDGSSDLEFTVREKNQDGKVHEEKTYLPEPEVSLIINAPEGADIRDIPFRVKSDVDLAVLHSRSNGNWKVNIVPNDLHPETPTSVTITVGDDGP